VPHFGTGEDEDKRQAQIPKLDVAGSTPVARSL